MSTFWDWALLGYTPDNVIVAGKQWCKRGYHPEHNETPGPSLPYHPKLDPEWFGACEWCDQRLRRYANSSRTIECDKAGNVDEAPF